MKTRECALILQKRKKTSSRNVRQRDNLRRTAGRLCQRQLQLVKKRNRSVGSNFHLPASLATIRIGGGQSKPAVRPFIYPPGPKQPSHGRLRKANNSHRWLKILEHGKRLLENNKKRATTKGEDRLKRLQGSIRVGLTNACY